MSHEIATPSSKARNDGLPLNLLSSKKNNMFELLKDRSVIRISGADALKFLQNMTTNDLVTNNYSYNYLLSPGGRYLYDFFVAKISNEELLLDVEQARAAVLIGRLNLYKLRSLVQIEDISADHAVLYSKSQIKIEGAILSYQDPRFHKLGFRSILKSTDINNLEQASNNLYSKDKYEYCIPDGQSDLIIDKSIPNHFGGEELNTISFSKGCYVGQEVVSRAKYQGVIRKKIFKLIANEDIQFSSGIEITDLDQNKIGILCSRHNNLGIALLEEETYLALKEKVVLINGEQKAEVIVPEWRCGV
jgi:folate-binding protein YgfZ